MDLKGGNESSRPQLTSSLNATWTLLLTTINNSWWIKKKKEMMKWLTVGVRTMVT